MAWDTERTRRRLLEAATAEFAEHGPAGARVDRIAERAEVNKERIYSYFGGKDLLFDAVVAHELGEVAADVPLEGSGPDALGRYAARLLDRAGDRPELARLLAWEGLQRGEAVAGLVERQRHCAQKVDAVCAVLPGIERTAAAELLLAVITIVHGWSVFPQLSRFFLGDGAARDLEHRAFVEAAATAIAERAIARPAG